MIDIMLKRNVRGSISILLIIILLPMMAVASVLIDLSRYELAKSMISSSADLAMNAELTYYEKTLKDVYGIFAVSADETQLQDNLYNYFVDSLIANGVVKNEKEFKNDEMLSQLGDMFSGNIGEVINMESLKSNFSVKGIEKTSVAEPEILKTQIVEFMKYRTPVYGTMSMLDGLKSLKKILKQNKVMQKQADVNEKIGDFNDNCEETYNKIKEMQNYFITNEKNIYWDSSYNVEDYEKISNVVEFVTQNGSKEIKKILYSVEMVSKESEKIGEEEILGQKLLNIYTNHMCPVKVTIVASDTIIDKKNMYDVIGIKVNLTEGEKNNALENMRSIISSDCERYLENLDYIKQGYQFGIKESDLAGISEGVDTINMLLEVAAKLDAYNDYLIEKDSSYGDTQDFQVYSDVMKEVSEYSTIIWFLRESAQRMINLANMQCSNICTKVNEKLTIVKDLKTKTVNAKKSVSSVLESVDKVNNANNEFQKSIDNYNGSDSADSFSSSMSDEAGYNKMSFDKSEIEKLESKLELIESTISTIETEIGQITYSGVAIKDISDLDKAVSAYKSAHGTYNVKACSVNGNITEIPDSLYPFWKYLKEIFENTSTSSEEEKSKGTQASELVKEAKRQTDSALSVSDTIPSAEGENKVKMGSFPTKGEYKAVYPSGRELSDNGKFDTGTIALEGGKKAGKYKGFSKMLSNMSSMTEVLFSENGILNALKSGRDNLYVTDYCLNMFSYYTYEKEVENGGRKGTMTGVPIDSEHNQLYGGEVEYITFGGKTIQDSVKTSKRSIFVVRFICNAGYTLTSSNVDVYTFPPAMSIQLLTAGIVPYKLPEIVFELAFALAESYVDMELLCQGKEVPLIKNASTFTVLGGSEGIKIVADTIKTKANQAISGTVADVTSSFNNVIDNTGSYVENNIQGWTNDFSKVITDSVNDELRKVISKYTHSVVNELSSALEKPVNELYGVTANSIMNKAWNDVVGYADGLSDNNIIKSIIKSDEVKNSVFALIPQSIVTEMENALNELRNNVSGARQKILNVETSISNLITKPLEEVMNGAKNKINEVVKTKVDAYGNTLKNEFGNVVNISADRVMKVTNSAIDDGFDGLITKLGIEESDSGSISQSSLLSFSYKEYLEMFLFLRLCIDGKKVMARVGDVIQLNVGKQQNRLNGKNVFQMSRLYTYVELKADVKLHTMFISDSWFENLTGNSKSSWDISYYGVRGY